MLSRGLRRGEALRSAGDTPLWHLWMLMPGALSRSHPEEFPEYRPHLVCIELICKPNPAAFCLYLHQEAADRGLLFGLDLIELLFRLFAGCSRFGWSLSTFFFTSVANIKADNRSFSQIFLLFFRAHFFTNISLMKVQWVSFWSRSSSLNKPIWLLMIPPPPCFRHSELHTSFSFSRFSPGKPQLQRPSSFRTRVLFVQPQTGGSSFCCSLCRILICSINSQQQV